MIETGFDAPIVTPVFHVTDPVQVRTSLSPECVVPAAMTELMFVSVQVETVISTAKAFAQRRQPTRSTFKVFIIESLLPFCD